MKILFILGLLGSLASAGLAFYTRSQKKDARLEKDRQNRLTVRVHEDTDGVIKEIKDVHASWLETKTNSKNEKIAATKAKNTTEQKETELQDTKKAHEEVMAKRQQMNDEINRILGANGTPEEVLELGATKGNVGAVNTEWGFVVVNMGSNQGVTVDSKLLVKRGLQMIGKVNIIQINPNQTVADINPNDLIPGQQILPGDTVVFEPTAN